MRKTTFELELDPVFGEEAAASMTAEQEAVLKGNIAILVTLGTAYLSTAEGMAHWREWVFHQVQCTNPAHDHPALNAAGQVGVMRTMVKLKSSMMRDISDLFESCLKQLWGQAGETADTPA